MSEDGMTPLMVATLKGAVDVVQALINGKADITLRSKGGSAALSIAEEKHYSEIEQLLRINLNQRMLLAGGWRLGFDVGAPAGGHCSYRVVREMSFGREAKSGDRLLGKVEVEYVAKSAGRLKSCGNYPTCSSRADPGGVRAVGVAGGCEHR